MLPHRYWRAAQGTKQEALIISLPAQDAATEASARLRAIADLLGADAAGGGAAAQAAAADARLAALLRPSSPADGGASVLSRGDLSDAQARWAACASCGVRAEGVP